MGLVLFMEANLHGTTTTLDRLTALALEITTTNLHKFGNQLSQQHIGELSAMLLGMSELARGKRTGRYAYDLDCGLGKTQAVVGLCAAIHQLKLDKISVAVSASQVEALCQLKRELLANGIPPEKIGLTLSYRHDSADPMTKRNGYASEPRTEDNDLRQFQLVTHARVKGGREALDQYARYKGKRRSLLVYDESLIISEPTIINVLELEQAWGYVRPSVSRRRRNTPVARRLCDYMDATIKAIQDELDRQASTGVSAEPITLEVLKADDLEALKNTIPGKGRFPELLRRLLDMSQERLRAVYTGHGDYEGVVMYDITVPSELENMAILDASYPIRLLEKMDTNIIRALPADRPR